MSATSNKPLLTLIEAEARTGISRETWRQWVAKGRIPYTQPSGERGAVFVSSAFVDGVLAQAAAWGAPGTTVPVRRDAQGNVVGGGGKIQPEGAGPIGREPTEDPEGWYSDGEDDGFGTARPTPELRLTTRKQEREAKARQQGLAETDEIPVAGESW